MNTLSPLGFKSLLAGLLLTAASWTWALPTPQDIQTAVQAGQYTLAETQLREVLHDKPGSAKAHYELGQVLAREGRYADAQQELRQAQQLEPSLKFTAHPQQFEQLQHQLSAQTAGTTQQRIDRPAVSSGAPGLSPSGNHPLPWGWVVVGLAGVALLIAWVRRTAQSNVLSGTNTRWEPVAQPQGYGPASYNANPGYTPPASPMGAGVKGAVLGGIAGLATGYALSKALEGGDHSSMSANPNNGYIPFDAPGSAPDFGAFDAGTGDGWDNNDSADNW